MRLRPCVQAAAIALEASAAAALPRVRAELRRFWHAAAEISGKAWALLGGPQADALARRLAAALQPQQSGHSRALDDAEARELETLLCRLVAEFARAEAVAAAAEALLRRLPGCRDLASALLDKALDASQVCACGSPQHDLRGGLACSVLTHPTHACTPARRYDTRTCRVRAVAMHVRLTLTTTRRACASRRSCAATGARCTPRYSTAGQTTMSWRPRAARGRLGARRCGGSPFCCAARTARVAARARASRSACTCGSPARAFAWPRLCGRHRCEQPCDQTLHYTKRVLAEAKHVRRARRMMGSSLEMS